MLQDFQRWQKGCNRSEYVSADLVPQIEANLQSYTRFESLVADYVELTSTDPEKHDLMESKKRQIKKSFSLQKPKSKTGWHFFRFSILSRFFNVGFFTHLNKGSLRCEFCSKLDWGL